MRNPIILLDMDGVMANFHQAVFDLYGQSLDVYATRGKPPYTYAIHEWAGVTENKMWEDINNHPCFWSSIAPYEWYIKLYEMCWDFGQVRISTSPGLHHSAWSQKIQWIKKFLPAHPISDIMMGSQKHLMANPNHILIDDSTDNVGKFIQFGGHAILFPQKWNINHEWDTAEDKLAFVRQYLREMTQN